MLRDDRRKQKPLDVGAAPPDTTSGPATYEAYVKQAIEAGLADSSAGRTMPVRDVRAMFGLPND